MSKKQSDPKTLTQVAHVAFMYMHEQDYPPLFHYDDEEQGIVIRNILRDCLLGQDGPITFEPEDIETITENVISMQKELAQRHLFMQSEFVSRGEEIDPRLLAFEPDENAPRPN